MRDVETTPLEELTPMHPEVLACPHLFNSRLRREAPVYQCPHTGITCVSDYETITRIAKDHETFSNRFSTAMAAGRSNADPRVAGLIVAIALQQQRAVSGSCSLH